MTDTPTKLSAEPRTPEEEAINKILSAPLETDDDYENIAELVDME